MNSPSSTAMIEAIHATPTRVVLAATGGGSQAISRLLEVGGASRTVLEAIVPYSSAALDDWLHARPEHYCSPQTVRAMAMAAFERARRLTAGEDAASRTTDLAGVACTASLASDRPKRRAPSCSRRRANCPFYGHLVGATRFRPADSIGRRTCRCRPDLGRSGRGLWSAWRFHRSTAIG